MKKLKIVCLPIIISLVIWASFFVTDNITTNHDLKPTLCVKTADYDDGGSAKYTGVFYNVYHVKGYVMNEDLDQTILVDKGYYVTVWFYTLDDLKDKLDIYINRPPYHLI